MTVDENAGTSNYLRRVLTDGATPFAYRSRLRPLLGLPGEAGPTLSFATPLPAGRFTYAQPRFTAELLELSETATPSTHPRSYMTEETPAERLRARDLSPIHPGEPAVASEPSGSSLDTVRRRTEPIRVEDWETSEGTVTASEECEKASPPRRAFPTAAGDSVIIPGKTGRPTQLPPNRAATRRYGDEVPSNLRAAARPANADGQPDTTASAVPHSAPRPGGDSPALARAAGGLPVDPVGLLKQAEEGGLLRGVPAAGATMAHPLERSAGESLAKPGMPGGGITAPEPIQNREPPRGGSSVVAAGRPDPEYDLPRPYAGPPRLPTANESTSSGAVAEQQPVAAPPASPTVLVTSSSAASAPIAAFWERRYLSRLKSRIVR